MDDRELPPVWNGLGRSVTYRPSPVDEYERRRAGQRMYDKVALVVTIALVVVSVVVILSSTL